MQNGEYKEKLTALINLYKIIMLIKFDFSLI